MKSLRGLPFFSQSEYRTAAAENNLLASSEQTEPGDLFANGTADEAGHTSRVVWITAFCISLVLGGAYVIVGWTDFNSQPAPKALIPEIDVDSEFKV